MFNDTRLQKMLNKSIKSFWVCKHVNKLTKMDYQNKHFIVCAFVAFLK